MFKLSYIKWIFVFAMIGFFTLCPNFVQSSSNPYYIGPSGDIQGVVTDDSGSPIANANVYYTAGDVSMGYGFYYATTDKEGKFSITNVMLGNGTLTANARLYNEGKAENVEVTENSITNQTIALTPAETGSINGVVTDADGKGVAGITIAAFPTYYFPEMMTKDGNISGGMKNMTIVKSDEGVMLQKINPSKIKKDKVKVDKKHKGKGKGKPSQDETKATKDFAGLFFPNYYMYESITPAVTDSNGNYSFGKLTKGSYSVYVDLNAKSGFERPKEEYFEIQGGEVQEINFQLNPLKTGSVSGRVINPKGDFVSGAMVDIYSDTFYGYSVTDKDGNYSMLSVPVGKYQVSSFSQYFWMASKLYTVVVEEGKNSTVEDIQFKENEYTMPGKIGDTGGDNFIGMTKEKMKEKNMGM